MCHQVNYRTSQGPVHGLAQQETTPWRGHGSQEARLGSPWLGYSPESLVSCPDDFGGAKFSSCAPPGLPSSLEASPHPREWSKVRSKCEVSVFYLLFFCLFSEGAGVMGSPQVGFLDRVEVLVGTLTCPVTSPASCSPWGSILSDRLEGPCSGVPILTSQLSLLVSGQTGRGPERSL